MERAAQLLSIALARYPDRFDGPSASGIAYLAFLATMPLTGVAGLLPYTARRPAHGGSVGGTPLAPSAPEGSAQGPSLRFAMSSRAGYRHTRHDVRTSERPAALLRDPRQREATRAAPRWPADHRPQFRVVARAPRGEQAGDRGGTPGPRTHRRHRSPDDHRSAGR